MKKRERLLMVIVGVMVAGYLGHMLFNRLLQAPLAAKYERVEKLKRDITKKQGQLRRARQASAKLAGWQEQSLPSNQERAASLYQEWLLDLVGKAGLKTPNVDSGAPVVRKGVYSMIPFSIRGRGTIEQLTRFLYEFYSANHLHQVTRINITPVPKSNELDLSLAIEALALVDANDATKLSGERSERLASVEWGAYRPIVDRNLFGQTAAELDPADFAFLTAILDVDGVPQAWLTVRTTGEILKLRPGQAFEVGQFRGTVAEITSPDIVIDSDEERWLLTLGEKLSQATALPPGF
jgi:Tfp pilus assembly protein PilO